MANLVNNCSIMVDYFQYGLNNNCCRMFSKKLTFVHISSKLCWIGNLNETDQDLVYVFSNVLITCMQYVLLL
jgi:hypothetical protein